MLQHGEATEEGDTAVCHTFASMQAGVLQHAYGEAVQLCYAAGCQAITPIQASQHLDLITKECHQQAINILLHGSTGSLSHETSYDHQRITEHKVYHPNKRQWCTLEFRNFLYV
jgi:hypothetical protein